MLMGQQGVTLSITLMFNVMVALIHDSLVAKKYLHVFCKKTSVLLFMRQAATRFRQVGVEMVQ